MKGSYLDQQKHMSLIKDWDKTKLQKLYNLLSPIPAWPLDLGGSRLSSLPGLLYFSQPLMNLFT